MGPAQSPPRHQQQGLSPSPSRPVFLHTLRSPGLRSSRPSASLHIPLSPAAKIPPPPISHTAHSARSSWTFSPLWARFKTTSLKVFDSGAGEGTAQPNPLLLSLWHLSFVQEGKETAGFRYSPIRAASFPPRPPETGAVAQHPYSRSHARDPAIVQQALSWRPPLSLCGRNPPVTQLCRLRTLSLPMPSQEAALFVMSGNAGWHSMTSSAAPQKLPVPLRELILWEWPGTRSRLSRT